MKNIDQFEGLQKFWEFSRKTSVPSKLWVACLINPEACMMLFMQTERDWPLYLYTVAKIFPYFLSDGHHNYKSHVTYYLNDMKIRFSEIVNVQANIKTNYGTIFSLICTWEHHLCMGRGGRFYGLNFKQKQASEVI